MSFINKGQKEGDLFYKPPLHFTYVLYIVNAVGECSTLNLLVSRVFDFPVNNCRKSWYSLVSEICIFTEEYIFMVEKNAVSSSNNPKERPPAFAKISPNLSHVQWGRNIVFGCSPRFATATLTLSITSVKNWWNVLLHLPKPELKKRLPKSLLMWLVAVSLKLKDACRFVTNFMW